MDAGPIETALEVLEKERRAVRSASDFLRRALFAFAGVATVLLAVSPLAVRTFEDEGSSPAFGPLLLSFVWGVSYLAWVTTYFAVLVGMLRVGYRLAWGPRWLRRRLVGVELSPAVLRPAGAGSMFIRGLGGAFGFLLLQVAILALSGALRQWEWETILGAVLMATLGMAFVAADFRHRRNAVREALGRIDSLEGSLRQCRPSADEQPAETASAVEREGAISVRDWNQIARMERQQIGRERQRAVAEGLRESSPVSFAVVKTPHFVETVSSLAPGLRLRIEEEAEALSRAPHPREAEQDAAAGRWRLRVPDTPLVLSYAVDDALQLIHLLGAREPGDD